MTWPDPSPAALRSTQGDIKAANTLSSVPALPVSPRLVSPHNPPPHGAYHLAEDELVHYDECVDYN
jgi:hypothetical protein